MKKIIVATMVGMLAIGVASDVMAGANPAAQLAIDAQPRNLKRGCGTTYSSCSVIQQVEGTGATQVDAVVVLYDYNELTGVEYALDFNPPIYITGLKDCAGLVISDPDPSQFPGGPFPHIDVAHAWSTCQDPLGPGVGISVGWIQGYIYGPTHVHFGYRATGEAHITDCAFQPDEIHTEHDGYFGGATPGTGTGELSPCEVGPTAAEHATWGQLKDLYR